MNHIQHTEIILYVSDQQRSADFYRALLRMEPVLNVPGMTAFDLSVHCRLGLMPNDGIAKILADKTPHPQSGNGIPRCELYLHVADIISEYQHALTSGATPISAPADRNWGDSACYIADPDGHIIAFAIKITAL